MHIKKEEVNLLKGFAILAVILSHANGMEHLLGNFSAFLTSNVCRIGMASFLFLSGYGLYKSYLYKGVFGFWKKRFFRILIPYWIWQIILIPGVLLLGLTPEAEFSFRMLDGLAVLGIYPVHRIDPTMWYVSYILFLYAIFWCIVRWGKREYHVAISIIFLGILLIVTPFWWKNAGYCCGMFPLGMIFACIENEEKQGKTVGVLGMFMCLLLMATMLWVWSFFPNTHFLVQNVFFGTMTILAILISRQLAQWKIFHVVQCVGELSYGIYLVEYYLIVRVAGKLRFLLKVPATFSWIVLLGVTVVVVLGLFMLRKVQHEISEKRQKYRTLN
ncbi:MAG: acyltransferase [Lachnospiraceae bacterium]|nr:acyltransferase [Lachnospiraceae bacterium]